MKHYLIIDIDGTVSDCSHREEFAKSGDWEMFHSLCVLDKPYRDVIDIIRHMAHLQLIGCTGRNESNRMITIEWLRSNGLAFDHLLMRPDGDFTKDIELKIRLLEEHFGGKAQVLDSILAVFEDRDRVVAGLRDYGLTVLQPREGAY